ncbi:hypothetical protein ACF0H5_006139 [Mactra antiquata]
MKKLTTRNVNWNMNATKNVSKFTTDRHISKRVTSKGIVDDLRTSTSVPPTQFVFNHEKSVQDVNCAALINSDVRELEKTKKLTMETKQAILRPEFYINITNNCTNFISKRGYITDPLTDTEKNFPLAFSIIMYKDIEQSERLLRAIYRPQNIYCIHVDSKTSASIYKGMLGIAECFENVFVLEKRYDVVWGRLTVITPELHCMEKLLEKKKDWKYFINLTGQEFPLRTNLQLVKILKVFNGTNHISGVDKKKSRYSFRWQANEPAPHGIIPTKGSVHIVASRGFVEFVCFDKRALDFLLWTNLTKVPDETFFPSLNHNNPFLGVPGAQKEFHGVKLENGNPRYISRVKIWTTPESDKCKGRVVRGICVFGVGDLPMLASRRELFINKLFLNYEHYALDCLEELHYNRTRDEYMKSLPFDAEWYSMFVKKS